MASCKICGIQGLNQPESLALEACDRCRAMLGIVPMPPTRRPVRPCMRCNATRFVRAIPREQTEDKAALFAATLGGTQQTTAKQIGSEIPLGTLELYICAACGFVEWYCHDPSSIPIGPAYMTEIVDHDSSHVPYR